MRDARAAALPLCLQNETPPLLGCRRIIFSSFFPIKREVSHFHAEQYIWLFKYVPGEQDICQIFLQKPDSNRYEKIPMIA